MDVPESVQKLQQAMRDQDYLADRGLATSVFLALSLGRPLLLEGEPGTGKTEVAKVLAAIFDVELIRLQCYEGIDANQALYEWDYTRQILYTRALSEQEAGAEKALEDLFSPRFLVERPLLKAVKAGQKCVLLVDEVDRADDEFEAFLLEVLSDFQVTVPEIGTIRAKRPPAVVLTSNRTRELHDALKRRALYHWIDFPSASREAEILMVRAPEVPEELARKVATAVQKLRTLDLAKKPGIAESIDWARAIAYLGERTVTREVAEDTLGSVVKEHDDLELVRNNLSDVLR